MRCRLTLALIRSNRDSGAGTWLSASAVRRLKTPGGCSARLLVKTEPFESNSRPLEQSRLQRAPRLSRVERAESGCLPPFPEARHQVDGIYFGDVRAMPSLHLAARWDIGSA